ncbi:hypothetical protein DVH24_016512 [Malus domestica]|uniref:Uncharacterized protein n=1 Tax=Malus domestica TaxID=3750 RepID=A0A498HSH4_MALDO|nr:hypothetical protein DVH24_016512 [Malus domestica]
MERILYACTCPTLYSTRPRFIKSTSHLSLGKSNEIVLKLQSFHMEKVRARDERDEFWSQFRPRYKPKTCLCLRPILKKFKKVCDYGKHHDDDSATFHSNPKFQGSFGVFQKALARENENVFDLFDKEAKDSVEIPPFLDFDCKTGTINDLEWRKKVADLKLLARKGEDSLLCDVGICSFPDVGCFPEVVLISVAKSGENDAHHVFVGLQPTVDIASLKLGFHEFTRDKGGTTIQRLFHSKSATVLESDCKNGKSQVFILEIHVSNVEFKKAKLPGSRALYLFNKMSNSGYILDIKMGYHMSIRDKGGTNFLFSFESILASYKDSGFCVVIDRDKCGTISQRLFNLKSKNKDCVLGSHWSKVFKCEVSFDSSIIIDGEDAGYLGLHHLEACIDKNIKNGSKFTFSRFETSFCVVVHCDMCYCKGIRDKGGDSKFRKSADDEEKMVNLYFNRIGWPSSLPTNEKESFVKNVLQKKKMAMDEFLMSEKLTLRPGVEEFIDDAYKEGIHVVLLTTYSKSGDQIGRSIVEKLGKERISKLKIVGYKEVDLSFVDKQLAKEAIKVVFAEKQRIAEEVASMLQLSVDIDTSPPESLEKIIAAFRVGGEVAGLHVCDCVLISNAHFSCLNESGNSIDCSQDGMIGVVMLVAYTTCIVVGGVFCSTYIELGRAWKMTFPIVREDYMVHSFHMQKKLPFGSSVHGSFGVQDKSHILEGGKGIYTTTFTSSLLTGRGMMTMTDIGILKTF